MSAIDLSPYLLSIGDDTEHVIKLNNINAVFESAFNTLLGSYAAGYTFKGFHDASSASYPAGPTTGDAWVIDTAGTISAVPYKVGDVILYDGASWIKNPGLLGSPAFENPTAQTFKAQHTAPDYYWDETDAAADNGLWKAGANSEQWFLQAVNDAESIARDIFRVNRTGAVIDDITYGNTTDNPSHYFKGGVFPTDDSHFGIAQTLLTGNGWEYIFHHPRDDTTRVHLGLFNSHNSTTPPRFRFVKSRGGGSSNSAIANGDQLAQVQAYGDDGTSILYTGAINFNTDGAVSTGIIPTNIEFYTMDSAGVVRIGARLDSEQILSAINTGNFQQRLGHNSSDTLSYDLGRNSSTGIFHFYGNQSSANGYVFESVDGEYVRINGTGLSVGGVTPQNVFQAKAASNRDILITSQQTLSGAVAINAVNDANSANIPMELRASEFLFSGPSSTVKIGTAGGISFDSGSNYLSAYKKGLTFTPGLTFGGGSTGMTGTFAGTHSYIGDFVQVDINIALSNKGTSTGNAVVTNLPFAAANDSVEKNFHVYLVSVSTTGDVNISVAANSTAGTLININSSGTAAVIQDSAFTNTSVVRISFLYRRV